MRRRFVVTVEVFMDADWMEGEKSYPDQNATDVVWDYVDALLPDTDEVGANVKKVRRGR